MPEIVTEQPVSDDPEEDDDPEEEPDVLPEDPEDEDDMYDANTILRDLEVAREKVTEHRPDLIPLVSKLISIVIAETTRREIPPEKHDDETLAAFRAHVAKNRWEDETELTASEFIEERYKTWLGKKDEHGQWIGPALYREDILAVEPKLAAAYASEIRRPNKLKVEGLYIRPHKLPAGAPRTRSRRTVDELSTEELKIQRKKHAAQMKQWRSKQRDPFPNP